MMDNATNLLLALHLLGVAVWVGGMAFALLVLRPSLGLLPPAQRLTLHTAVFQRFFRIIWHVMPLVLLSGYGLVHLFGGFAELEPPVHIMHGIGLAMAVIFMVIFFGPWKAMRAAQVKGDTVVAMVTVNRIRHLITANLVLGTITIVVAAFA